MATIRPKLDPPRPTALFLGSLLGSWREGLLPTHEDNIKQLER
jgi:hypothetical protein